MKNLREVLWDVSSHSMLKILPGVILLLMMMSTFSARSAVAQSNCSGAGFPAVDYVCVDIVDDGQNPRVSMHFEGASPWPIGPVTIGDYEVEIEARFEGSPDGIGIEIEGTITRLTSQGAGQLGIFVNGGWGAGAASHEPGDVYSVTLDAEASGSSSVIVGGALGLDTAWLYDYHGSVAWISNPGATLEAYSDVAWVSAQTENFQIPLTAAGEVINGGDIWALNLITYVNIAHVGTVVDLPTGIVSGSAPLGVGMLGENFEVLLLDVEGELEHFRKSLFRLANPDACGDIHWHSNTGYAVSLEGNTLREPVDPARPSCGYGGVDEVTVLDLNLVTGDTTAATSITIGPEEVLFIDTDATLTVPDNLTITNTGHTLNYFGTINNQGTITNEGAITNKGTITNECGGIVDNTGTITGNPIIEETCPVTGPIPGIMANDSEGTLNISRDEPLSIAISLDPGNDTGTLAAWYLVVQTPTGEWQSFNTSDFSKPGFSALIENFGLLSFGSFTIASEKNLSAGKYTYYFVLVLGDGRWFLASVVVNVQ